MDGLRGGYPDEQEGRWYPGDRGYGDRYEDDRYRLPEPRHAEPEPVVAGAHPLDTRPVGPRSGVELPPYEPEPAYEPEPPYGAVGPGDLPYAQPAEPTGEQHHTQPIDRAALRRPPEPVPAPTPTPTLYRTRRAGVFGLIAAVAAVAELLLVRVLLAGEFGPTVAPGAVLGGLFAMAGVPLVALGLYGLLTGPAPAAGPAATRVWLRPPLVYLPIGLTLLIAAGLAAG